MSEVWSLAIELMQKDREKYDCHAVKLYVVLVDDQKRLIEFLTFFYYEGSRLTFCQTYLPRIRNLALE